MDNIPEVDKVLSIDPNIYVQIILYFEYVRLIQLDKRH